MNQERREKLAWYIILRRGWLRLGSYSQCLLWHLLQSQKEEGMFQIRRKRSFTNHGASFPVSGFRSLGSDIFRVVASTLVYDSVFNNSMLSYKKIPSVVPLDVLPLQVHCTSVQIYTHEIKSLYPQATWLLLSSNKNISLTANPALLSTLKQQWPISYFWNYCCLAFLSCIVIWQVSCNPKSSRMHVLLVWSLNILSISIPCSNVTSWVSLLLVTGFVIIVFKCGVL